MRTIGIVTVSRSDYGIYLPILERIERDPDLALSLYVGGMHLDSGFGHTADWIERDGFDVAGRVEMLEASDAPEGISRSIGRGVAGFAECFAAGAPDILVVLGDRFEMFAAAVAATPFTLPVAHIHGGETTEGAFDEGFRHCITKLSHLHFVSTEMHSRRVIQLGEEPWRVTLSGAPALDHLRDFVPMTDAQLEARIGQAPPKEPFLLVTYHPVTLDAETGADDPGELLAALDDISMRAIITLPNADTGGRQLGSRLRDYSASRDDTSLVDNLGIQAYFTLMGRAAAMVGNSSSGIIEAASLGLPVVNVGSRQKGRERGANVLDVGCERTAITAAIREACSDRFRKGLDGLHNPYGDGTASGKIVSALKTILLDRRLLQKRFHMLEGEG